LNPPLNKFTHTCQRLQAAGVDRIAVLDQWLFTSRRCQL